MCVLAILADMLPGYPLIVAANRDEFYSRESAAPAELRPGIVAGQDLAAGGTWLGVNRHGLVAAVTNRGAPPRSPEKRSRGLLCLEALAQSDPDGAASFVERAVKDAGYAGFNMILARGAGGVCLQYDGALRAAPFGRGVHVVSTNRDLDEAEMPELSHLQGSLRLGSDLPELWEDLRWALSSHEESSGPICKHSDLFGTVSSTILAASAQGVDRGRLWHCNSAPCTRVFEDRTPLLRDLKQR